MPHEVKYHTVPHFKGLTNGLEPSSGHRSGTILHSTKISRKAFILLPKDVKQQFHVNVILHTVSASVLSAVNSQKLFFGP